MILPPAATMRADLRALLDRVGEPASPEILGALQTHLRLLAVWNPRYKLTRIEDWPEILDRHVRESLLALKWIGPRGRLLDVGSGNGFPAIPILACRPGVEGFLVERSERKALFLDAAVRETGIKGTRIETIDLAPRKADDRFGLFDFAISRATLAPLKFLELAETWVVPGGRVFLYASGRAAAQATRGRRTGLKLVERLVIDKRHDSSLYVLQSDATPGD